MASAHFPSKPALIDGLVVCFLFENKENNGKKLEEQEAVGT